MSGAETDTDTVRELRELLAQTTPGPWESELDAPRRGFTAQTRVLAKDPRETIICEVTGAPSNDTTIGDARLVSLAPELAAQVIALSGRVTELEQALEFYADPKAYEEGVEPHPTRFASGVIPIELDRGSLARTTLEQA